MGPPLKAAENPGSRCDRRSEGSCFNGAAAKSSGKSTVYVEPASTRMVASMGPPLKAAENSRDLESFARLLDARFNGAAAKSSGKYGSYLPNGRVERASMGPPLKAAENPHDAADRRDANLCLQWGRR